MCAMSAPTTVYEAVPTIVQMFGKAHVSRPFSRIEKLDPSRPSENSSPMACKKRIRGRWVSGIAFPHVMQMFSAAVWRRPASTLLVLLLSSFVVASRDAAAAAVSEDVPIPGGTAALAQALGIDPVPDRGRFIYELSRLLYNAPEGRKPSADA